DDARDAWLATCTGRVFSLRRKSTKVSAASTRPLRPVSLHDMSSSLRDQLLKVGLVTEEQVKKAEQAARRPQPRKPKPTPSAADRARAEKAERDRELNRRKAEKAEAKARAAQIRQIVEQHRIPPSDDGDPFH